MDVRTIPGHSRISSETRYRSSGLVATTRISRSVSPAGAWHSSTSGIFAEGGDGLVEVALVQFGADRRRHAAAQRGRKHAAAVGTERARRRHPLQARLDGSAGQAEALGENHDGQPRIVVERREDPPVCRVELLQSDHSLSVQAHSD